jgi:hypothetical protein
VKVYHFGLRTFRDRLARREEIQALSRERDLERVNFMLRSAPSYVYIMLKVSSQIELESNG